MPTTPASFSAATERPRTRNRRDIPDHHKWDLSAIFPDWVAWKDAHDRLEAGIDRFRQLRGALADGPERLLEAFRMSDELDELAYKVWYYPALHYDEDQRDNEVNARRQQVQILMATWQQAVSWFNPELLRIPEATVRGWLDDHADLAVYRFAIENLYRQQEHVLDESGERLMSLTSRFGDTPADAFSALSTADVKHPTVTLSTGESVVLSYGEYRAVLATRRLQADRERAFTAMHELYRASLNTYASLYNGVLQRDWFHAQARGYGSTLEASLHRNNIPTSVVENLIASTRAGVEPLRRYHRLRKRALALESYHLYDFQIPLVEHDTPYPYEAARGAIVDSVEPLGADYQGRLRESFAGRWIDVYENEGKRSGAYSAPVYGVHPYVLMNYNDTLDAAFTLAHEMGHSMHTILSHETQPLVHAAYTIFVAEVPSTLSEVLFLEHTLARTDDPKERIVLLQHALDSIAGTFYSQVLFADYELEAHRLVEQGQAITADILTDLYGRLLAQYYGDALTADELARITWARIPHFFHSPYYVYQYATCFASAAKLGEQLSAGATDAEGTVARYLTLLRAGGSDYPMELLKRAGVDLSQPDTVQAVVTRLDGLVTRLEAELAKLDGM